MKETIMIVDDEREIADLLEVYLLNDGYQVYKFYNGTDFQNQLKTVIPDLLLLDVMLPDADGFQLCQKLREKYLFPIIMLTAKSQEEDKLRGFSYGADEYV